MRDATSDWKLPGRLTMAAGIAGFGVIALAFNHVIDGLFPVPDAGPPWPMLEGVQLLVLGLLLAWPRSARIAALAVALVPGAVNLIVRAPALAADAGNPLAWVPAMQVLGIASAALLIALPDRAAVRIGCRLAIGAMLVLFGGVHWTYVEAIAGMIPDWIPGRALWPWVTGAANVAAGLALIGGVAARPAAALVGLMFAAWIPLVHLPALAAAPGERTEWVALALCLALIGAVWTLHGRLAVRGEESRP